MIALKNKMIIVIRHSIIDFFFIMFLVNVLLAMGAAFENSLGVPFTTDDGNLVTTA